MCIRNCVVDVGVSSYMLVIPDGLHYTDVGWKPMLFFSSSSWRCIPLITATRTLKQEDHKF